MSAKNTHIYTESGKSNIPKVIRGYPVIKYDSPKPSPQILKIKNELLGTFV